MASCAGEVLSWLAETQSVQCGLAAIRVDGERYFRVVATLGLGPAAEAVRIVYEEQEAYSLFPAAPHTIPLSFSDSGRDRVIGFVLHLGRRTSAAFASWFGDVVARRLELLMNHEGARPGSLLLTNMSHEFRTPLNTMLGYASMLRQGVGGTLPLSALRQVARIEANGRHLDDVVSAMIDISAIESGQMPLTLARFDLRGVVARAVAKCETVLRDAPVVIVVDLPDDASEVTSDERKVERILGNLLSNAVRFTHKGRVTIAARRRTEADAFEITVTDTGIGLTAEEQARLFLEPRLSDDASTQSYGSMGLGLAVSRRLARLLGGALTADSRPGQGAVFTLSLPLREPR